MDEGGRAETEKRDVVREGGALCDYSHSVFGGDYSICRLHLSGKK